MSGRPKIKIHQYDKDGKKIKMWEHMQALKNHYFKGAKYPMFVRNDVYHELPDGTYACKEAIGRDKLMKVIKINNSQFIDKERSTDKKVEVYNLLNEKIAEFKNIRIAVKMTGISQATIHHQVNNGKNKGLHNDFLFKYKK